MGKDTQDPVSKSDKMSYCKKYCEVSKPQDLCLIALKFDRHLSNSAKTHSIKEYRQTHEYAHQDLKNSL